MPSGMSFTQKQRALIELSNRADGCIDCQLHQERSSVVFGQGTAEARVLVVGEAPGKNEDLQGIPFVGRSGKLLRQAFSAVGLSEQFVYITNVVKCRPPDNRNPRPPELAACRYYLDRQLELIDPEIILSLGNFALRYFLGESHKISTARGQSYQFDKFKLIPTYHPSYLLYSHNPEINSRFQADLRLAVEHLEERSAR